MAVQENVKRSRDQSISSLQRSPGRFYPESLFLPGEWATIFGQSHSTIRPDKLKDEMQKFAAIPKSWKVTKEENLMEKITAEDIQSAISSLQRRKSDELDGLNKDFYQHVSSNAGDPPTRFQLYACREISTTVLFRSACNSFTQKRRLSTSNGLQANYASSNKLQNKNNKKKKIMQRF